MHLAMSLTGGGEISRQCWQANQIVSEVGTVENIGKLYFLGTEVAQ